MLLHLYPSYLQNMKNLAYVKLIYFLGKLLDRFSFILIVHLFAKLQERNEEYGYTDIHDQCLVRFFLVRDQSKRQGF